MISYKHIQQYATRLGLKCVDWEPGDGVRRIRFFPGNTEPINYFMSAGLYTALGVSEAKVFLDGYALGLDHGQADAHTEGYHQGSLNRGHALY